MPITLALAALPAGRSGDVTPPILFAATEALGLTPVECLLLLAGAFWPLVPFLLAARSVLSPEPVSRLALAVTVAGSALLAYFILPVSPSGKALLAAWWYAGLAAILLTPLVVLREGRKRGWFRRARKRPATKGTKLSRRRDVP